MLRNTKLGILFLFFTQWQVKRGLSSSDLAVFRGHFLISLAVFRGGLQISSSRMGRQLYGEPPPPPPLPPGSQCLHYIADSGPTALCVKPLPHLAKWSPLPRTSNGRYLLKLVDVRFMSCCCPANTFHVR